MSNDLIPMTVRIEYLKEGDIVVGIGTVKEVLINCQDNSVKLIFQNGNVSEGFYGAKLKIHRKM